MGQVPCRLLRDPQVTVKLHTRHTFQVRGQEKHRNHPCLVSEIRSMHGCPCPYREERGMFLGPIAIPTPVCHGLMLDVLLYMI